ncbi:DUF7336 domain-containing protein [Wukongibacter sp. M2B1]|uniref:DUF7336 domain-containing protein n=1 Tax=Wukongibacter sp. M2B1 TaxID=3088895 RepID=UPI003D7B1423
MKVYVVLEINEHTEYEYCGVFGTGKQAEDRIEEIVKEHNVDKEQFYIEEEEITM